MAKTINPKETSKSILKPLAGYLVIEPTSSVNTTSSGIVLPESAQERPDQGRVLVVGEDQMISGMVIKSPVKVGDVVIYKKWGGNEIKFEGKEYKLIRFEDLMATVEEEIR